MAEMKLNRLQDINFTNKRVFMRVDFNVPIKNGRVLDTHRIHKALPSIRYILEKKGRLILASHLGRPTKNKKEEFSLKPVAEYLTEEFGFEIIFVEEPDSRLPHMLLKGLKENQILLLENLRFHEGEQNKDQHFAERLASYSDIYINEGFSISHRDHASITLLPQLIPVKAIGFQFQKEIKELDRVLRGKESPFFVILGGSKVADKIPLLDNLIEKADEFFIGGAMAYIFLKAKGVKVGDSLVHSEYLNKISNFLNRFEAKKKTLWLPEDHIITKNLNKPYQVETTQGPSIPEGYIGMDIGPRTRERYCKEIERSKFLFWNGPLGFFERSEFSQGTELVAQAIAQHKGAYRIVGGGHSAFAIKDFEKEIDHVSTGGGASLHYLKERSTLGMKSIYMEVRDSL